MTPLDWDARLVKVRKWYTLTGGDTAKIQDHFPSVSRRTIQRWVKRAKEEGYL